MLEMLNFISMDFLLSLFKYICDIFKVITGHKYSTCRNKRIPVCKKFADQKMTLEERYNAAMIFYNSLYNKVELVEEA